MPVYVRTEVFAIQKQDLPYWLDYLADYAAAPSGMIIGPTRDLSGFALDDLREAGGKITEGYKVRWVAGVSGLHDAAQGRWCGHTSECSAYCLTKEDAEDLVRMQIECTLLGWSDAFGDFTISGHITHGGFRERPVIEFDEED